MSYAPECVDGLRQMCHDIRQPVAGVLALAAAALSEADLPDNARRCLDQIVWLAEWQSDLIGHWLWAPGGRPSDEHPTDVLGVVTEVMAAQRVTWAGDLTLLWPPEPAFVHVPEVTMRRMVANLVANAARAGGPAGRVTIEVISRGAQVLLAVEDDGPGFGRIPRHFGLGLSAVARGAMEHQGRLECGQGSLGGARVSLWLPAAAPQEAAGVMDTASAL